MTNPIADPFVEVPDTDAVSDLAVIEATPEGAVTVTLNAGARGNAFDAAMVGALRETFETLRDQETVRVVFVRGAGGHFSVGADPAWLKEAADRTEADNRDDAMQLALMLKHLHDIGALTVALVEGVAAGPGAGLAAACDRVVATAGAAFSFPEVKLGLIPAVVAPHVVQAVGARAARRLFASGETVDAETALRIGLADEIVADGAGLDAAKARIAAEVAACAPLAIGEAKKLVDEVVLRAIDHGAMSHVAHRTATWLTTSEAEEGLRALIEGRPPAWTV